VAGDLVTLSERDEAIEQGAIPPPGWTAARVHVTRRSSDLGNRTISATWSYKPLDFDFIRLVIRVVGVLAGVLIAAWIFSG